MHKSIIILYNYHERKNKERKKQMIHKHTHINTQITLITIKLTK